MEERSRKVAWVLLAIAIIGMGIFIIIHQGFMPMEDAKKDNPEINEVTVNGVLHEPYFSNHLPPFIHRIYDFPQRLNKNGLVDNVDISIFTSNTVLFEGDKISFIAINAFVPTPIDVDQIYIFFIDSRKQLKQSYNVTDVFDEIRTSVPNTPIIKLVPAINQTTSGIVEFQAIDLFNSSVVRLTGGGGLPPFAFVNEGYKIPQIFVIHSSGKVETKIDTEPIFKVNSDFERLQSNTEIDTIREIRSQNITDADIVGLSWIAIGLAFIIVGVDIILRIFLEPYTDDMKNVGLFKRKLLP